MPMPHRYVVLGLHIQEGMYLPHQLQSRKITKAQLEISLRNAS
jgi:hypothetical protein